VRPFRGALGCTQQLHEGCVRHYASTTSRKHNTMQSGSMGVRICVPDKSPMAGNSHHNLLFDDTPLDFGRGTRTVLYNLLSNHHIPAIHELCDIAMSRHVVASLELVDNCVESLGDVQRLSRRSLTRGTCVASGSHCPLSSPQTPIFRALEVSRTAGSESGMCDSIQTAKATCVHCARLVPITRQ